MLWAYSCLFFSTNLRKECTTSLTTYCPTCDYVQSTAYTENIGLLTYLVPLWPLDGQQSDLELI